MKEVVFDHECPMCEGYGITTSKNDLKQFATVCWSCKGSGFIHNIIEYKEFKKKLIHEDVKRVFPLGSPVITQVCTQEQYQGGLSYQDWLNGKPFPEKSQPRESCCPTQWARSADPMHCPEWPECEQYWKRRYTDICGQFDKKDECWKKYDEENS